MNDGIDLAKKRIAVTGGGGFLGSYLLEALAARGCRDVAAPRAREMDLRTPAGVSAFYDAFRPEIVIHAAAVVGGIGANRAHPGSFFHDNAIMGILLIEEARRRGVEKFVCLGTICAYPKFAPVPFREDDLWNGYPEETNAPYGLAKKMLLVQIQSYRAEYDFPGVYLLPVNLYGPNDHFDLATSHVIPALIRKCIEAKDAGADAVDCWGTGNATREFLFVRDAAEGILAATERYDAADPVNLGSGEEISIRNLAQRIARLTGFKGELRWDPTQPDGQPRRLLDTRRAAERFGWRATTTLDRGLDETIAWYKANRFVRA